MPALTFGHKTRIAGLRAGRGWSAALAGCTAWHLLTATRVEEEGRHPGARILRRRGSGGRGCALFAVLCWRVARSDAKKSYATASAARQNEQLRVPGRTAATPVEYGDRGWRTGARGNRTGETEKKKGGGRAALDLVGTDEALEPPRVKRGL